MALLNLRKWPISRLLWLCISPLALALVIMVIVSLFLVQQADDKVTQVTEESLPLERATMQMQLSAHDGVSALSDYVMRADPADADRVRNSEVSFEQHTQQFANLVHAEEEKRLAEQLLTRHAATKETSSQIIDLAAQQHAALLAFQEDASEIGVLIVELLQATTATTSPDVATKLDAALDMKASLDKASAAVEAYVVAPNTALQQDVLDAQVSFQESISAYQETDLSAYEDRWLAHMGQSFEQAATDGLSILDTATSLHEQFEQFEQSTIELLAFLEDQIEPLVSAGAGLAAEAAQEATSAIARWLIVLTVIGVLASSASALALSRIIIKPIRQLVEGAEVVDSGKLDYRFNVDAKGEFGQLAFALNQTLRNLRRSREVLGESEETAWALLDSTSDSVILMDRRGTILASNEVAAERFGQSLEQMVDMNLFDLLPEDLATSRKAQVNEVLRTGKPLHFEDEREGMILDQRIYPVFGPRGEVSRIAIFGHDVTMHRWVEEVTERLGRRNELILEAAGEGIYGLDTDGKTTFVNPAAARMLGYRPQDLIGQRHHELVHHSKPDGSSYPHSQCPIYAAFKDGTVHNSVDYEVFWRKDGTAFPVEYTSTPIIDKGNIVGAVVTFRNITDRKRMEEILLKREERYRSVFESAANLIISVDSEGTIVDSNSRSKEILGYAPDQIIGKGFLDLIHTDDRERAQVSLDVVLSHGFDYHKRYRMVGKDGAPINVQINAAAAKDSGGKYIRTICMIDTLEHGQE